MSVLLYIAGFAAFVSTGAALGYIAAALFDRWRP